MRSYLSTQCNNHDIFTNVSMRYELSNHLGNVLSTVSDMKNPIDANNNSITDSFEAIVLQQQSYYPFGMFNVSCFSGTEKLKNMNPVHKTWMMPEFQYSAG